MPTPKLSVEQLCRLLKCTKEQLSKQYRNNSEDAVKAADKSIRTGKLVNGFRAGQWVNMAIKSDILAQNALK